MISSFYLNGHTQVFRTQIQKLEPPVHYQISVQHRGSFHVIFLTLRFYLDYKYNCKLIDASSKVMLNYTSYIAVSDKVFKRVNRHKITYFSSAL